MGEETEAWRGQTICLNSSSWYVIELGFKLRQLDADSLISVMFLCYLSLIIITHCPKVLKLNDFSSENSGNNIHHFF